jgi:hypothetical protein
VRRTGTALLQAAYYRTWLDAHGDWCNDEQAQEVAGLDNALDRLLGSKGDC